MLENIKPLEIDLTEDIQDFFRRKFKTLLKILIIKNILHKCKVLILGKLQGGRWRLYGNCLYFTTQFFCVLKLLNLKLLKKFH